MNGHVRIIYFLLALLAAIIGWVYVSNLTSQAAVNDTTNNRLTSLEQRLTAVQGDTSFIKGFLQQKFNVDTAK